MTESTHPVIAAAQRYRQNLLDNERQSATRLVAAYGRAYVRMGDSIAQLEARLSAGVDSEFYRTRVEALRSLRLQAVDEINRFAVYADQEITANARAAIAQGIADSGRIVGAYAGNNAAARQALSAGWDMLPSESVETMLGFLAPDSPLHTRLVGILGETVAQRMETALTDAITLGFNPRKTAEIARRELGVGLTWALNTARTAQMYAYREATRANYMANSDVVAGWTWYATLGRRTCMGCIAQHGTRHPVTETLNDHHAGRCVAIPTVRLAGQLGISQPEIESGEQWFRRQPEDIQLEMMGPGMFDAWQLNQFNFKDLSQPYRDPVYGTMLRQSSLKDLLARGGAAQGQRQFAGATTEPDGEPNPFSNEGVAPPPGVMEQDNPFSNEGVTPPPWVTGATAASGLSGQSAPTPEDMERARLAGEATRLAQAEAQAARLLRDAEAAAKREALRLQIEREDAEYERQKIEMAAKRKAEIEALLRSPQPEEAIFTQLDKLLKKKDLLNLSTRNAMQQAIKEYIRDNATYEAEGVFHAMSQTATFKGFNFRGNVIYYEGGNIQPVVDFVASEYLRRAQGAPMLTRILTRETGSIYFTAQGSKDEEYFRAHYNNPNHVSAATGGDGDIVVYSGRSMTAREYAHELGHNLAKAVYNATTPERQSLYRQAMETGESAVSTYGENDAAEDFAESVREYVQNPTGFAAGWPKRYAVIDAIMRTGYE